MTNTVEEWPGGITAFMNATWTQANAAGGTVIVEISPGAGNEFEVLYGRATIATGTNGIQILPEQAANNLTSTPLWSSVSSVATPSITFPSYKVISNSTSDTAGTVGWPMRPIISGTMALALRNTGAGAQNDTFAVFLYIRCKGAMPTVSIANSTNAGNVSVTAGTGAFTTV